MSTTPLSQETGVALRRVSALLILGLAACQSPESSADLPGLPDGYQDGSTYEQPSEDRSVEAHLSQLIKTSKVIDGYRVVELELSNRSDEVLSFAYSVEWLDREGKAVGSMEASWTPLVLGAGQTTPIEFRAPSPRADSWRLMAATIER